MKKAMIFFLLFVFTFSLFCRLGHLSFSLDLSSDKHIAHVQEKQAEFLSVRLSTVQKCASEKMHAHQYQSVQTDFLNCVCLDHQCGSSIIPARHYLSETTLVYHEYIDSSKERFKSRQLEVLTRPPKDAILV